MYQSQEQSANKPDTTNPLLAELSYSLGPTEVKLMSPELFEKRKEIIEAIIAKGRGHITEVLQQHLSDITENDERIVSSAERIANNYGYYYPEAIEQIGETLVRLVKAEIRDRIRRLSAS